MCYVRKRKKSIKKRILVAVFALIFAALGVIIFINRKLDAIVKDVASEQIRASISRTLSDIFKNYAFDGEYIKAQYEGGAVKSVTTNTTLLNALSSRALSDVSAAIEETPEYEVKISLSNIFDDEVILGSVPISVRATVLPTYSANADIRSELSSAGINQSHYKLYLSINVNVTAVLLISTVDVHTEYEICICDMLIVGDVPQFYVSGE